VNGSVEVGHETAVVLAGDATELVAEETASRLEGGRWCPAGPRAVGEAARARPLNQRALQERWKSPRSRWRKDVQREFDELLDPGRVLTDRSSYR
jgi:hypothetical protein